MNAYALNSKVLTFFGSVDPTDANSTALRAVALDRAQEAHDEFWMFMDGADFQRKTTTITVTSGNNYADLPSDFMKFGDRGQLVLRVSDSDRRALEPLTDIEIFQYQESNGSSTGIPQFYCVMLQQGSDYTPLVQFDIKANATYTLSLLYFKVPPTLTDTNDNTSGLQFTPVEYHSAVMFKGALAKYSRHIGDARWPQFESDFKMAMANAKASRASGQEAPERILRGGAASWEMW